MRSLPKHIPNTNDLLDIHHIVGLLYIAKPWDPWRWNLTAQLLELSLLMRYGHWWIRVGRFWEKESLVGLLSIQILSTSLKLHTGGLLVTVAVLNMISPTKKPAGLSSRSCCCFRISTSSSFRLRSWVMTFCKTCKAQVTHEAYCWWTKSG